MEAAAVIGWRPCDFWDATPAELSIWSRAHAHHIDVQRRLMAWQACAMLQPHLKKGHRLTPGDLLGEKRDAPPHFTSKAEMVAYYRAKQARIAGEL